MVKILFAATESSPFVKTGGLGEVIESLPRALKKQKVDVRVIMPKYGVIPATYRKQMVPKKSFNVPLSWRNQYAGIEVLDQEGIRYYFLDNEGYFKREGIYGYYDEAERFAFFCRAVLEAIPHLDFTPDIIHCHDWQTGMIPLFLKVFYGQDVPWKDLGTVFTIHNLKYQGVFGREILGDILGLEERFLSPEEIEFHGQVSFMKAGIVYADVVTTVSKTYAEEIKMSFYGENLDGLLRARENKLIGIPNGIDYKKYNPERDPYIFVNYRSSLMKKEQNKTKLQEEVGLPVQKNVPLLGMVSRLTPQKGLDLLLRVLREILSLDLQVIILGAGEERYEQALRQAAAENPQKLKVFLMYNDQLAHKIYAASDLFLMPSVFEPCGLGQLIAMRYGTLPLVRETGGLKDTVLSYNEVTGEGNGFSFSNINAHDFLYTVERAVGIYHSRKDTWNKIVKNALKANYSWEKSARAYSRLYEKLASKGASQEMGIHILKKIQRIGVIPGGW